MGKLGFKLGQFRASLAVVVTIALVMSGCLFTRVTVGHGGVPANGDSALPSISDDGNIVAFISEATNLTSEPDTNGEWDVFLRNRANGAVVRVSESEAGVEANGASRSASVSGNGQFVLFMTEATNLGGAASGVSYYRYQRSSGDLALVATGLPNTLYDAQISDDGGLVVFTRLAEPGEPGYELLTWTPGGGASVLLSDLSTGMFALSGDGSTVVVRHDQYSGTPWPYRDLEVYDVETAEQIERRGVLSGPSAMHDLLISDSGQFVSYSWSCYLGALGCDGGGGIAKWNVATNDQQVVASIWSRLHDISDSGRYAVMGHGQSTADPELRIQDTLTGAEHTIHEDVSMAAVNGVGSLVAFTSTDAVDGQPASGFNDIFVWNRASAGPIFGPAQHGDQPSAPMVEDPVNAATGNFYVEATDISFPGSSLALGRSYNGLSEGESTLGRRWTTSFDVTATRNPSSEGGSATMVLGDGREVWFPAGSSWAWGRALGIPGTLIRASNGSVDRLEWFSGALWDFDSTGRLVETQASDGEIVTITRDGAGVVQSASSSLGFSIELSYDGEGRLGGAEASDGRVVEYTYDADGDLRTVTGHDGVTTTFETDAAGRIARELDGAGRLVVENAYDTSDRVIQQENAAGAVTTFQYLVRSTRVTHQDTGEMLTYEWNDLGHLTAVVDPSGNRVARTYDDRSNPTGGTDRLGAVASQTYNADDLVESVTEPGAGTTTFEYDGERRLIRSVDPTGAETIYGYDGNERLPSTVTNDLGHATTYDVVDGLVRSVTDADGVTTTYEYWPQGWLRWVEDELGNRTTYEYDTAGRPTRVTSPEGRVSETGYDAQGRVAWEQAPDGDASQRTTYTYFPDGQVQTVTDPLGAVTTFTYDAQGRLHTVSEPGPGATGLPLAVTTYTYDNLGQLIAVEHPDADGDGPVTSTDFGLLGRVDSRTDEVARETTYGYDVDGNQTTSTNGAGDTSITTYQPDGRVATTVDGEGGTTTYGYDEFGRAETVTDPMGEVTTTQYDDLGRAWQVTDPRGGVTSTAFTPGGRVLSRTDAAGLTTTYDYDDAGRLEHVTGPDGGVTTYGYDGDGNQLSVTNPEGEVTATTYDAVNRVATVTDAAGVVTTRTWSRRGELLTEAVTGAGTATFVYDLAGNLSSVTDPLGATTTITSDHQGRRIARTDADGNTEHWSYFDDGQLQQHTDRLGRITARTYDAAGRLQSVSDGSGRSTTIGYDDAGRVTSRAYGGGGTDSFTYDAAGRVTAATDASGSVTYDYDPAGALTELLRPDGRELAFTYDSAGRRTTMRGVDGQVYDYGYDAVSGRLAEIRPRHSVADTFTRAAGLPPDEGRWTPTLGAAASAAVSGNRLVLGPSSTVGERSTLDAVGAGSDVDVAFTYQFGASSPATVLEVGARDDGADQYLLTIQAGATTGSLAVVVDDVPTSLGTFAVPAGIEPVRLRLVGQGSALRVRAWPASGEEPSTWGLDVSDSAVAGTGLWLGWSAAAAGAPPVSVDNWILDDPSAPEPAAVEYTYDLAGRPDTLTFPNGTRTYDWDNGRVVGIVETLDGVTRSMGITYDSSGRRQTTSIDGAVTTYGYDLAGQLTSASGPDGLSTWSYDDQGRRTTQVTGGVTTTYAYDDAGQLCWSAPVAATPDCGTVPSGATIYAFDGAGRRISETGPTGTTTYGWDAEGRLVTVDSPTLDQVRTYDPAGTMIAAEVDGSVTAVDWDLSTALPRVAGWDDAAGAVSLVGRQGDAAVLGGETTGTTTDPFGSAIAPEGVAMSDGYDVWGVPTSPYAHVALSYRSEMQVGDLVHLRARDYDPRTGQFLSPDALDGILGTTMVAFAYHYSDNSPTNLSDPSGLRATDCIFELSCSVSQFDAMSIDERIQWLTDIVERFDPEFFVAEWFNNIFGVLDFARSKNLVEDSSWFSVVDSAILQGIQEGLARATGTSTRCTVTATRYEASGCNPGGVVWEEFFVLSRSLGSDLSDEQVLALRALWGDAEQRSTDYGLEVAAEQYGLAPTPRIETVLIDMGNMYRAAVADPDEVPDTIRGMVYSLYCAGVDPIGDALAGLFGQSCRQQADDVLLRAFDPRTPDFLGIAAEAVWQGASVVESLREAIGSG